MPNPNKMNMRKRTQGRTQAAPWSPEDCERFLSLRSDHSGMPWDEFQQTFYPGRTSRALQQRLYMIKIADKSARSSPGNVDSSNSARSRAPRLRAAKVADVLFSDPLDSDSYPYDTDDVDDVYFPEDGAKSPEEEYDELGVLAANITPHRELENSRNEDTNPPRGESEVHSNPAKLSATLNSQHSSSTKNISAAMSPTHFSNKLAIESTSDDKQPSGSSSHLPSLSLSQITEDDAIYFLHQAKCAEVYKSMLEQLMDKFTLVKPEVGKITAGCSDIIQSKFGRAEGMDTAYDTIEKIFREIDGVFKQIEK
ncbi:hypothetical protein EMCG_02742 [[Emmonsia] crescens]|uniref:Myb-like domain-containing protein n=1 Tax=[Emmonsia] crescens TaxID=73230 RepID=A0A0G2HXA3_9EURO|nr:hypothetical protein EMCG_02742 [Emmonsia crescens UAMH 3008]